MNVWEGADAAEEVTAYCERWGIEATVLIDETAQYARRLGIRGVPTNVLVDDAGIVRVVGASSSAELLREAVRLEPRLAGVLGDLLRAELAPSRFAPDGE